MDNFLKQKLSKLELKWSGNFAFVSSFFFVGELQYSSTNLMGEHPQTEFYKGIVNRKLKEIQTEGYYWEKLLSANENRKVKTDWVRY